MRLIEDVDVGNTYSQTMVQKGHRVSSPKPWSILPAGKSWYSFLKKLEWTQSRSGYDNVKKNLHPGAVQDQHRLSSL